MTRNLEILLSHWQLLAFGLFNTVWICAVSAGISLLFAVLVTPLMMSRHLRLARASRLVIDAIRCIPFLLFAYLLYYCGPMFGIRLNSWTTGLLALVIYNTAYLAEILRGAWSQLPADQEEAARAFGFTSTRLFTRIVAPQIFISAGPMLGNQIVALIKDSAFLMIITIPELTFMANSIQARYFIPLEALVAAALLYWILCRSVESSVKRLERVADLRGGFSR